MAKPRKNSFRLVEYVQRALSTSENVDVELMTLMQMAAEKACDPSEYESAKLPSWLEQIKDQKLQHTFGSRRQPRKMLIDLAENFHIYFEKLSTKKQKDKDFVKSCGFEQFQSGHASAELQGYSLDDLMQQEDKSLFYNQFVSSNEDLVRRKYLYIRHAADPEKIAFGLLEFFSKTNAGRATVFTLINSRSVPDKAEREIYVLAGELFSSLGTYIMIPTRESHRVDEVVRGVPIFNMEFLSPAIRFFEPVAMRNFNLVLSGSVFLGTALIQDGDGSLATSACSAFLMHGHQALPKELFESSHDHAAVRDVLRNYCVFTAKEDKCLKKCLEIQRYTL